VKYTDPLGEKWNQADLQSTADARFRGLEGVPFIEQADGSASPAGGAGGAGDAPLFEILGMFQCPVQV
jgi:hypothetical protein